MRQKQLQIKWVAPLRLFFCSPVDKRLKRIIGHGKTQVEAYNDYVERAAG